MRKPKTIMTGVAVLATLTLPLVAGAANKLVVNGTDGVTPVMTVTDTGWVGSGTSAPVSPFHAVSSGSVYQAAGLLFQFQNTEVAPRSFVAPNFSLYRNNSGGALPNANDALGYFNFGSIISGAYANRALIYGKAEKLWTSATDSPSFLQFMTNPGGIAANREVMRLDSKGTATVNGGLRLYPYTGTGGGDVGTGTTLPSKPACSASTQGTLWFTKSAGADTLQICADGSTGLAWRNITIP
ncbi:hypothetical protein [Trichlorobacter lovleyi]|uniref:Uncharacterized protein n=1 Tax=Trichlorobacter lovleyi (strain ATCC BAA-1151 / DSM 17278 / SZ) TaxID=398767 RepID=B3E8W6_TRIL1|nr:hypothetical protein [Trichlorobacter lovleyi]ACD95234.1 hypothetical protein Glov_1518 [Trichlorobacter lovleyi SZ]